MIRKFAILVALELTAILQAGCGAQPYPAGVEYPLRVDRVVEQLPANPPDGPPAAGKLDEFIARIDELGGKTRNPADLPPNQSKVLKQILDEHFGSPGQPVVRGDAECQALVEQLRLQPETLAAGSVVYRKFCLQCHGLTGDGRGPTGPWVYPLPRDFRQGVFKYVSSPGNSARKPSRIDLRRMLLTGIDRTSMPSFALLPENEREQALAYTIHLSLRGEVEHRLLLGLLSPRGDLDDDLTAEASAILNTALRQWVQADVAAPAPASTPTPEDPNERVSPTHLESVRRGAQLFANPAIGCSACHIDYGRQARYSYDVWGGIARATDLTEGAYRGGKRPIDLYARIHGGIGAAGMPAASFLSESQVWDLVHFLLALPTKSMLPPAVREQVYSSGR